MEISQEELDAKIKEAKAVGQKEGASAKASEMQSEVDRVKREADERVKKIESDAQRKVSEQGNELGELRKKVEGYDTLSKEAGELRSQIEKIEKDRTDAEEKARKEAERKANEPSETLSSMTEDEAKAMDKYLASSDLPEAIRNGIEKDETREQTLASVLQGLRDAMPDNKKKDTVGLASQWLQSHKRTDVTDPSAIRQTVREALKEHDRRSRAPGLPPTVGGGPNGDNKSDARPYEGFRQSMEATGAK